MRSDRIVNKRKKAQPITLDWVRSCCVEDEVRGCLVWTKHCHSQAGHPVARDENQRLVNLKRLVVELHGRRIRDCDVVVWKCGNKRCLLDEHLLTIPKKQHHAWASKNGQKKNPGWLFAIKAQKSGAFKINLDIAREWRASGKTAAELARLNGVSPSCAERVLRGETWKDPIFAGLMR